MDAPVYCTTCHVRRKIIWNSHFQSIGNETSVRHGQCSVCQSSFRQFIRSPKKVVGRIQKTEVGSQNTK